jgi:hypothetical protein
MRSDAVISPLTNVPAVDAILQAYTPELGRDFTAYRNHVYRVIRLCAAIAEDRADLDKIGVAAAFHDLGIWTNRTFDYIAPSVALAGEYLAANGRSEWIAEIATMIEQHHKITGAAADPASLVEPFRRADWIDVTRGLRTFGVSRQVIEPVFATWPSAGFHRLLVKLALERLRTHPLNPLPMVGL